MALAESRTGIGQLQRTTFRRQIVDALRASIISGELAPGAPVVEAEMARIFGVSRGPLREALGELIKEGLLVTVPYTGTHVVELSLQEVNEIFSLRTELEVFAFRQVWDRRDAAYRTELTQRHERLLACIEKGDDEASIAEELSLHSHVYESCGHSLLLNVWNGMRGKLQLYWAAHHRAHRRRGPLATGHLRYVELAQGDDLDAMIAEIRDHMVRGFSRTEAFLRERETRKQEDTP
ncbi:GntR family transcriptional regulator [Paracoccus sp. SCSIO 75233]|uniref:GntR family transcriptional regulator n=1 Tax=Paracoccus sp. SCSIO 75233 TaxID=3017782 RepID=UPI0022F0E66C|nr:GntR family transcriptional regulator [Paracoccus sp. SCSIO 75233]WBU52869.1 GntR family transcriptional regulator [Paracoccus sp. SCSIO 75233]